LLLLIPLVLGGLLLTKASPRLSGFGSPAVAYLVGVGAAAAIGGAVLGTIFPQVGATVNLFDWQVMSLSENGFLFEFLNGSIILVGTVTTLIYFHFGARAQPGRTPQRAPWIDAVAWVGKVFIAITFGALFAGVYAASLVALIERLDSFISMILP
jgi:hypothetical protein